MTQLDTTNFTLRNGTVLIGDRGIANGGLDILCCARSISLEVTASVREVYADQDRGPVDFIYTRPVMTIKIDEADFNETIISRALRLSNETNTLGYSTIGNGANPTTVPVQMSDVDGPHDLTYDGLHESTVYLNNGLLISGSVSAWYMAADGTFTAVAGFAADYTDAATNLPTGEVHFADPLDTTPLFFTYKYSPVTIGAEQYFHDYSISLIDIEDVYLKVIHEHTNEELWLFEYWRCRAEPGVNITMKTPSGERLVTIPSTFRVLDDYEFHPDNPLAKLTVQTHSVYPRDMCNDPAWVATFGA